MHILARIADQRDALLVPRQVLREVLGVESEQHLGRVLPAKEERVADRAVAVHRLEIQARAAGVPDQRRIVVMRHRGSVGCDVMRDELPEHGPARRHTRLSPSRVPGVAGSAGSTDGAQYVGTDAEVRKAGKHPRVAMAAAHGRLRGTPRGHAMVARRPLRTPPGFRPGRHDFAVPLQAGHDRGDPRGCPDQRREPTALFQATAIPTSRPPRQRRTT